MKFISGGTRVLLVSSVFALFGCSRSVKVDKIRQDPAVPTGTTTSTLPGFSNDPFVSPTSLGNAECTEESAPKIIIYGGTPGATGAPPPAQIGRFPTSGNSFVTFWTVCNASKVAQPPGTAYTLDIQSQRVDSSIGLGMPGHIILTPFKSEPLTFPGLAACACFVQEVGINLQVPSAAAQQVSIAGQTVPFPQEVVPTEPPAMAPFSFEYVASLPAQFGVAVLASQVN